jgi:predicted P-loop ATPase
MTEIVRLPVPASTDTDEYARADTERNRRLFDWALEVIKQLGLDLAVAQAKSIEELAGVALNLESAAIVLAIRDALHPASGRRQPHFEGLRAGGLKQILKNRLNELKKEREAILRRRAGRKGPDWTDNLILDKEGKIKPILANLILILHEAPKWKGVLAYDEFSTRVVIRKRPPWGEEAPDAHWTDHHESLTRVWLQREDIIKAGQGDIGRAVQAAARSNPFHPVREYLDSLVWDGMPRIDTWLTTYFHAEDSPYIRAIAPRYLISAVARVYQPGCKVDHMLVLEGPQGKQKSEALRALAVRDGWFTDRLSHLASKDAAIEIAGVWLVEIAEMDALTRSSSSTAKSFLTRRHDRFRPPYGKHIINLPRQCVFAGTINPPANGYLKDATGARRFWPVLCNGMIDRDGLEQDCDQLWAEAAQHYKADACWWLETPELEALAAAEEAERVVADEWEAPVRDWIGAKIDVSVAEVLEGALDFPRKKNRPHPQPAVNRVVAILTNPRLRFRKYRARTPKGRANRYWRDPIPAKNQPPEGDHRDQERKESDG